MGATGGHSNVDKGHAKAPYAHQFETILREVSERSSLDDVASSRLRRLIDGARVSVLPRRSLTRFTGLLASDFYLILQGAVQVTFCDEYGAQRLSTILGPGAIFGGCSVALPKNFRSFSCLCLRSSTLARLDPEQLITGVLGTPLSQYIRFQETVAGGLIESCLRCSAVWHHSLRERLVAALLDLAQRFGARDSRGVLLTLALTHQMLGDLLGASRQRITVHLKELNRLGAVQKDGRRLLIIANELHKVRASCRRAAYEGAGGRRAQTP